MLKKLHILFFLFLSIALNAQIALVENYDQGSIPSNWLSNNFSVNNNLACQNFSALANLSTQNTSAYLISPVLAEMSSGTEVDIQFDYKIIDSSPSGPVNIATSSGWGEIQVLYSIDGGNNWINTFTINDNNHIISAACSTITETIQNGVIPIGSDFQLKFEATWLQGDYYIYLDNVSINQQISTIPNCDAILTSPQNASVDVEVNEDLQWQHATGGAVGYKVAVGTTAGGTDIVNNITVTGGLTTYDLGILNELTTYYVSIIPYNSLGDAQNCTEYTFTTEDVCEVPDNVSTNNITPYQAEIAWNETGSANEWEILYGITGFDINTQGTLVLDTDGISINTISNLTPNTTYDVYVRAVCDPNKSSSWSLKYSVTTLALPPNDACVDATIINTFPYSTSQDATWATNNLGFNYTCTTSGMNDGVWYSFIGNGYDITLSVEETSLWDSEIAIFSGDCNNLICEASIDLAADIQTLTITTTLNESYFINIGYYSGGIDNPEGSFDLDVTTTDPIACDDPSNISFIKIDDNNTQVLWQENGNASSWLIIYGEQGFDPNSASANVIVDNDGVSDEVISGLLPDQTYEVYIVAVCNQNEMSNAVGPISFNTSLQTDLINFRTFRFFPNPFNSKITLLAETNINEVEVFSLTGKKVVNKKINTLNKEVDLSNLPNGMYLMKVNIEGSIKTFKIIKQ